MVNLQAAPPVDVFTTQRTQMGSESDGIEQYQSVLINVIGIATQNVSWIVLCAISIVFEVPTARFATDLF